MKMPRARRCAALLLSALLVTTGLVTTGTPDAAAEPATPAPAPSAAEPTVRAVEAAAANAPTFDDLTTTVTIPEVTGVEFLIDGQVATPGDHQYTPEPRGTLIIIVTARGVDGTPNPSPARWAHQFPELVTVPAPTFNDAKLIARTPAVWGVSYWLGSTKLTSNSDVDLSEHAGRTVTLTATSNNPKQVLPVGTTSWSHTFPARSVAPTFDDPSSTVTIPDVAGAEYVIDGQVVPPGPKKFAVPFGGQYVTVTVRGTGGAPDPSPNKWTHRFPEVVTMEPPTFDDRKLMALTPGRKGVKFFFGDQEMKSASWNDFSAYAGKTVTLRAEANAPSVTLLVGQTEWSHTFPAASVAPTFDDPTSTVTIPEVPGAEYVIDGQVVPPGPKKFPIPYGGQYVTVTVRGTGAAPDPSPNSWTHRFPEVVTMEAPTFDDRKLMALTPGRKGVKFFFGDQEMKSASWNDFSAYAGKSVTLRAVANSPTTLLLVGQTEWTHTFVNRPDYSLANGDEFNGDGLAAGWTPSHSNEPGNFKSVSRFENLSVQDGFLDIRTSRHCLASGTEEVGDANKSVAPCPAGKITRYSAGNIRSDFIYGAPKSMEVKAKLDADHHGITSTGWMHNDEPFCTNGVTDTDLAEFDVMEVWATESSQSFSHITCNGGRYHTNGVRVDQHIPGDWHTWRVEWDGYALRYFFDGKPQLGPTGPEVTAATLGLSQEKFLSAINDHKWQTVIGVKLPVNGSWAPWVDDSKDFPDKHDLYDYIRYVPLDLNACQPGGEIGKLWRAHPELGKPSNCEADANTPGARVQSFQHGRVYWSPATGAQIVTGSILDRFLAAGGDREMGLPMAPELRGLRDGGSSQVFGKSIIFFSPATGAHFVRGEILKRYAAMGYERGVFGYPTTDEVCGIRDGGCYQRFQRENGHIYWSWPTGAHSIQGAILARYGAMGYENGVFGYPTSDEICGLVGGGCHNRFQRENGHLYWSPASGAWGVQGAIYAHYAANGWEWGRLGYPTGPETCRNVPGALECTQTFQRSKVLWNSRTGARG